MCAGVSTIRARRASFCAIARAATTNRLGERPSDRQYRAAEAAAAEKSASARRGKAKTVAMKSKENPVKRPEAAPAATSRRSPRLRQRVAWMYYVEEMTQSAIADALGIGRITVVR